MPADLEMINGQIQMIYAEEGGMPWWGTGGIVMPGKHFSVSDIAEKLPTILSDHEKIPHYMWVPSENVHPDSIAYSNPREGLGSMVEFPGKFDIRRQIDMKPIGVVGNKYTIIQPKDIVGSVGEVILRNNLQLETAGLLHNGNASWFLCRIPGDYSITRIDGEDDVSLRYVLLFAYFDGSGGLTTKITTVRVVCSNTAALALSGSQNKWSIRHTANWGERIADLHKSVDKALGYYDEVVKFEQRLENTRMSQDEAARFFSELVGLEQRTAELLQGSDEMVQQVTSTQKRRAKLTQELFDLFNSGQGNLGLTHRDALNAVTEYTTHKQGLRVSTAQKAAGVSKDYLRFQRSLIDDSPLANSAVSLLSKRVA